MSTERDDLPRIEWGYSHRPSPLDKCIALIGLEMQDGKELFVYFNETQNKFGIEYNDNYGTIVGPQQ